MRRKKRSKTPWLFITAGAVFAGAVLWQILPKGGETATQLRTRLGQERDLRKRELQTELDTLRADNERLRSEIDRLREPSVE